MNKIEKFQIRWNEPLGKSECPYMYRWALILFGFSIRIHHWIRSDDKRFFHDHPFSFITFVLNGGYTDVSPNGRQELKFGSIYFRKAEHKHYVEVNEGGAWTLLFCNRPRRNWGFWIKSNQFFRPLRYFNKYGHPPCSDK